MKLVHEMEPISDSDKVAKNLKLDEPWALETT